MEKGNNTPRFLQSIDDFNYIQSGTKPPNNKSVVPGFAVFMNKSSPLSISNNNQISLFKLKR